MKEIKISIENELYEEMSKNYNDKELKEIAESLVKNFIKDIIEVRKKSEEYDKKVILIKILDENDEVYDGFWFGEDEEKAIKKMENFRKYKKKYKEKYKDKKIILIVRNEIKDTIIVNNLQENKGKITTSYNIYNVNIQKKTYF